MLSGVFRFFTIVMLGDKYIMFLFALGSELDEFSA
jgi:hypothetical protein